jgi:hypothetical protein
MTTHPTPDPESWLAGLQGQADTREAELLRRLIQANPTPTPDLDPAKQDAFIRDLRWKGAFANSQAGNWLARLREWLTPFQGHGLALAASVAMIGIGLSLSWRMGAEHGAKAPGDFAEPDIVMRGDEQAQRMVTANPRELANRIGEVLAKYQLPLRRVENGPLVQIQAKVPPGHPVRDELARQGVQVPAHGRLNLLLVQG